MAGWESAAGEAPRAPGLPPPCREPSCCCRTHARGSGTVPRRDGSSGTRAGDMAGVECAGAAQEGGGVPFLNLQETCKTSSECVAGRRREKLAPLAQPWHCSAVSELLALGMLRGTGSGTGWAGERTSRQMRGLFGLAVPPQPGW